MYQLVVTYKTGVTETTDHDTPAAARRYLNTLDNVDRWCLVAQDGSTMDEG